MFNYNTFTPTQSTSQHHTPTHSVHNKSPSSHHPYSTPNSIWSSPTHTFQPSQESKEKDSVPYDVRALLDNEDQGSSTSSDSEETDTMPEVSPKFKTAFTSNWDFSKTEAIRRKSEILSSHNSLLQNLIGSPEHKNNSNQNQSQTWSPFVPSKVNVKPSFFGPLNRNGFVKHEKKVFFVTMEGFKLNNQQRFFKIERLCHCMQAKNPAEDSNFGQFLYLSLWNDLRNNQDDSENIFEPWVYAIPNLNFRLVVKINMTHSQEDAYIFDFIIDLRSYALPTKEKRNQSLEVVFNEPSTSPGLSTSNNITLHLQVTNEKLLVPHGFRNIQESQQQNGMSNYAVVLRQIFIGLPLYRSGSVISPTSPLLQQIQRPQQPRDVYAKRGSAIVLGRNPVSGESDQIVSPLSWTTYSPETPPGIFTPTKQNSNNNYGDPSMPPGMMPQGAQEVFNYENSYQVKLQGAQRFAFRPQGGRRESLEGTLNRDFLGLLEQEKSSIQLLDGFVNNGNKDIYRRQSLNIDNTSNSLGKFQMQMGLSMMKLDSDTNFSASNSTVNVSSFHSMVEVVPFEEDFKDMEGSADFKIEDYIGNMAEFVKTYQGSKVLQNYVVTSKKEDLDIVFHEISEKIGELLLDPYANYMIQTLIQNGLPRQRLYLLQKLAPSFASIARDKKGTHSLQAIVSHVDTQDEFNMMKNIIGGQILELSLDPRANYVIQKLINIIPVEASGFLYQPLLDNFVQVANNSFGLLVLKQMMARAEQSEVLKQKILDLTNINFEKLVQNPYGNYAIQHMIENHSKDALPIMNKILIKIIPYSSQKISSNIIEKCLAVGDCQFRKKAVEEILKNGRLGDLMKNKYGNFVTLQLLATASTLDKQKLMQEMLKCANSFNGTKYKTRWTKFVEENPLKISWNSSVNYNLEKNDEEVDASVVAKDLEAVKKIWREMTKEEKGDSPSVGNGYRHGYSGSKGGYGKKQGGYGSWSSKN